MERFVVGVDGSAADAEREGFRWLLAAASDLGTEAAVIVPGVPEIEQPESVLGDRTDQAKKHRALTMAGVRVNVSRPPGCRARSVARCR